MFVSMVTLNSPEEHDTDYTMKYDVYKVIGHRV